MMLNATQRRRISLLALGGFGYFVFKATGALCICPHLAIGMAVCSAVAVVFGPVLLRVVGLVLLMISILAAVHDFRAKAAEDAKILAHERAVLDQAQKSNVND